MFLNPAKTGLVILGASTFQQDEDKVTGEENFQREVFARAAEDYFKDSIENVFAGIKEFRAL